MKPNLKNVKNYIEQLNCKDFIKFLEKEKPSEDNIKKILSIVYHSNNITLSYEDSNKEKRNSFLEALKEYFLTLGYKDIYESISYFTFQCKKIDIGYNSIFETMSRSPTKDWSSEKRISAVFVLLENYMLKIKEFHSKIINKQISEAEINNLTIDQEVYNIAVCAGHIIQKEAHDNNMFNQDKDFVLPFLDTSIVKDEKNEIVVDFISAKMWSTWKHIDEMIRLDQGQLTILDQNLGSECEYVDDDVFLEKYLILNFKENADEIKYLNIALDRISKRKIKCLSDELCRKLDDNMSNAFLKTAIFSLNNYLSVNLAETHIKRLPIIKILMGFHILKNLVSLDEQKTWFKYYTFNELEIIFIENKFTKLEAQTFIKLATFKKSSLDLFNTPLIYCSDKKYLLLGFTIFQVDLAEVVLSIISKEQKALENKGSNFEKKLFDILNYYNFSPKRIKLRRKSDKEELDFDIVFRWNDYVFFFECKNRYLPDINKPIAVHYFNSEIQEHIKQVLRLKKSIENEPELFKPRYPEIIGKKYIFCIVNALPFSREPIDGIMFSDESLISKFFESKDIGINSVGHNKIPKREKTLATLWEGEKPKPEEFIDYLKKPPQLILSEQNYETVSYDVQFSEKITLRHEYSRIKNPNNFKLQL